MSGMWLTFKVYGGPAEQMASRFVDEARVMQLAARDGATAQHSDSSRDVDIDLNTGILGISSRRSILVYVD